MGPPRAIHLGLAMPYVTPTPIISLYQIREGIKPMQQADRAFKSL